MELTTCNILGLDILVTDMKKTINLIEQNIEQLRGQYICVGNVHTTVMAHDDPQYHTVQAGAAFVLPMADHFPVTAGNTDSRMQSV